MMYSIDENEVDELHRKGRRWLLAALCAYLFSGVTLIVVVIAAMSGADVTKVTLLVAGYVALFLAGNVAERAAYGYDREINDIVDAAQ